MPGPVRQGLVAGGAPDRLDGGRVGVEIAPRVLGGAGALAQHVEGIAVEAALARARALQGVLDRLAEHEMIAHHAHGLPRRGAHGGEAEPLRETGEDALRRLARAG